MTLAHKILGQITVDSTGLGPVDPKPFVSVSPWSYATFESYSTIAAVSTDGITWTASTLPASLTWVSVTFGGGTYAAVAKDSATAAYSTDGITWTATALASSGDWSSSTYGGGRFVVVDKDSSSSAISTDGITWTEGTMPSSASWKSVTYGDGKFVAAASGTVGAYSTDGIAWTATVLSASADWNSVAYGGGKYVAVGDDTSVTTVATVSTDGITWTASTMPNQPWTSVTHGDGKFVAVAGGNSAAYSTDGITWTASSPTGAGEWNSVAYSGSTFAVVAGGTNFMNSASSYSAYSTDGITWTGGNNMPSTNFWMALSGGDVNHQGIGYTAPQTIYTVPSSTEAIVSSIFISNTSTTTDTYNFAVVPSGETLSDIHYIRKNTDIVAKDFHNIDTKITMSAGDSLVALSGAADKLNINVFGVEKS